MINTLASKKQNTFKVISTIGVIFLAVMMITPLFAFAAENLISGAILKVCADIGGILTTILNPICVLVLSLCLIQLIFGRNSKSAETALSWAKRVVICWVVFSCLGLLLNYGTSLMATINGGYNWS